jgi:GPH family glycoside/pentoside/hexuronide:cation symporter
MPQNDWKTPARDRLGFREKLAYGSGAIPFAFAYMGIKQLAFPIFNMTFGISATLIGVVLAVGRLWDAFTDPLMGTVSDNARTRWGRRRPFILLGSILCGLAFPLMFFVPEQASTQVHFTWLVVSALLMYTASTVYSVPWLSLSYELSPDSIERVRIQAYRAYIGGAVAMALPWIYRWAQADIFGSTIIGMRWISFMVSAAFIVFAVPVFLVCKERYMKTVSNQSRLSLAYSLRETARNRAFLLLVIGIVTSMLCGPMLVGSLGIYINSYYIFKGDTKMGASLAAMAGTVVVVIKYIIIPVSLKLSDRFGKISLMRGALLLGFAGSASKFFFYTPELPYLQFASVVLLGPAFTSFWLLVDPMKADCADYDELKTGHRREGTYAAVANWIEKVCITVILLFSGLIIDLSGFDPDLGGDQPDGTLLILRLAFAGVPALSFAIALICLHFYPLTDARMLEIRGSLEKRRGRINE